MTPRTESVASRAESSSINAEEEKSFVIVPSVTLGTNSTVVVQPSEGEPSFVQCESAAPFVSNGTAEEVNRHLNLNLGQSILSPENETLLWIIRFLNSFLIAWWEHLAFRSWDSIPVAWRRALCLTLWKFYFPLHKVLLGKRTGIHHDASYEYHALTSIMYWGRFFPVSVQRMRFSLSQLNIWCEEPLMAPYVEKIEDDETPLKGVDPLLIPECQRNHCTVKGRFIYRDGPEKPTEWTIMWVYGGAFLSGDVQGNLTKADLISRKTNMDVFVCEYRLVPEFDADDICWDMALAFKWLSQRRNPKKVILLGISSGGSVCVRQLQYIAEKKRGETLLPSYINTLIDPETMPAGAVLMGPFVDFTEPKGSLVHYPKHDLIVNQRVLETGFPFLDTHLPSRKDYSPVHRNFAGLPPLCVVVSEHEAVYDMSIELVNKARSDGVACTVAVWRYMCHVFSFLDAFIPEGRQSLEFTSEWIKHVRSSQSRS